MMKTIALSITLAMTGMICLPLRGGEPTRSTDAQSTDCGVCPHCGCCLVAVCHTYCTTKKVTEYKYGCACVDTCVPGVTPLCQQGCGGRCLMGESRKLVKYPVTKEVPVRKCSVEWVCPHCDSHSNSSADVVPSSPALPSAPVPPAPPAAGK